MDKEKRTKVELKAMIWDRCREAGMIQLDVVAVSSSPICGWEAEYTAPRLLRVLYSPQFAVIVRKLREEFDLAN